MANQPGPKSVVRQDPDGPSGQGAFFGEVGVSRHLAHGCFGAIIDEAERDIDEVVSISFKTLACRLCIPDGKFPPAVERRSHE